MSSLPPLTKLFRLMPQDNEIESSFDMKFSTTCVAPGSDLTQIDNAGGNTDVC